MRANVGEFLTRRAYLNPGSEAFVAPEREQRFTWAELNRRSNRTASMLASLGVGPGDRVALLLMNGVEFMESFFAVAKLGAVVVPLNWRLVPDELAFILQDAGARTLIFDSEFTANVADLHGRGTAATGVGDWIQAGGQTAPFAADYDSLHANASEAEPAPGGGGEDPLYIMYTSGTTGRPKGVVHTHETAMWGSLSILTTADVRHGDRYMIALPLFHVGALTPMTANVHRGGTSIVLRQFDPRMAWRLVETERLTSMLAVPAMLNFMFQVPEKDTVDRSSLRWIMSGAAPVPVSLIEAYVAEGIEIHQVYGLTETCGPACLIAPEDAVAKAGSTGKAFFHTDIRIVDEAGREQTAGTPGEVLVRGPHIMKEYWNRPEATAETLVDGWLHTGDVAVMDAEGFVYIQDRKKDMIISGGENIYPAEVENVLLAHPAVKDAAVIGQPSAKWGESPLAIVVLQDGAADADTTEILEFCRGRLARYKQPRAVEVVDDIPRNPSGKILKRVLRDRFPGPAAE